MKLLNSLIFIALFASQLLFSQKEKQNAAADTMVKAQYEMHYNKSMFDVYPLENDGIVLFFKSTNESDDFLDCIRLTTENLQEYETMDILYYASLIEENIKRESEVIESRFVKCNAKPSYYLLVYEKKAGNNVITVHHRIYFNNGFGFSLSLRTVKSKFTQRYSDSETILESFRLRD
ncbi:hypothetical protein [Flavobacterium sp. 3HN19-14]|uniref:hypothetical protein n=1 Tax=Flavobacterium sp. 3HN19-14 TaxID=3448133 RepID=UPI003EE2D468